MQCPVCHVDLTMTERQGIEIDYCPKCRGVWLDRGELDKIIARSLSRHHPEYFLDDDVWDDDDWDDDDEYEHLHRPRYASKGYHRKKRKSLISELFDF